jgi:predicted N-acetyltransferase YhbS
MMADEVVIRDARPDDRPAVRELTLRAYAEFGEIMAPVAWAGLDRAVRGVLDAEPVEAERIVAERDGRIVGSVLLYPPAVDAYDGAVGRANWPEVRLLAVDPDERGRGIGKALMAECIRRARSHGASELGLHSSDSLRAAVTMYERMGFERAPVYDFQPPGAELVKAYRLSLGAPDAAPR